jgi:hypothetical protein
MYSLDQDATGIPASSVIFGGRALKISLAAIGGSYEGKLSPNGDSIAGSWTQGSSRPLNLVHATPATAWTIPEPLPPPKRMPADADPVFEVATIKPSKTPGVGLKLNPSGLFSATGTSLRDLIKFAYDLHSSQIVGGPGLARKRQI